MREANERRASGRCRCCARRSSSQSVPLVEARALPIGLVVVVGAVRDVRSADGEPRPRRSDSVRVLVERGAGPVPSSFVPGLSVGLPGAGRSRPSCQGAPERARARPLFLRPFAISVGAACSRSPSRSENCFTSGMKLRLPSPSSVKPGLGTLPRPLMKPRAWLFGLRLPRAWTFGDVRERRRPGRPSPRP